MPTPDEQPPARDGLVPLVAAVAALALAWQFVHDDGFITLRYVDRWLHGKGLTWTAGPPVEGYTHPLWLLQLALVGKLGVPLTTAARSLGLLWLGVLVATWRSARAHPLVLAALVALPAVARWTVSGLETVSFAALAVLTAALVERLAAREATGRGDVHLGLLLGLVLGAATLTRPEGAGLAVAAGLWLLARRHLRALGGAVATGSVLVGALLLFRHATYGQWVSTSSAAKLGDLTLPAHVASFLVYVGRSAPTLLAASVPVVLAAAFGARGRLLRPAWLATPLIAAMVLAGGDHMPVARFFVPVVALLAFGAGLALAERIRDDARGLVRGTLLGMVGLQLAFAAFADPVRPDFAAGFGRPVGRVLQETLPPGTLVATATAGATPFYAPDLDFLDTLGLNDATIAGRRVDRVRARWQLEPGHRKGDGAYVLAQQPSVVILGGAGGTLGHEPTAWFLTDRELLEDPAFLAAYRPYGIRVDLVGGELLPYDEGADYRWFLQTGLPPQKRPPGLQGPDATRSFVLIAWLREGDPRVDGLRSRGVDLSGLREGRPPRYDPFCAERNWLLSTVPCDDGSHRG